jgi:RES domain-containing protein
MAREASATGENSPLPLTVWRICRAQHARFDGEGARLYGGRWNHPGAAVVYTSGSLSLAALELFVHVDTDLLPVDLVSVPAQIPARLARSVLDERELPARWRTCPPPEALQDLGSQWAERGETAVLSVPSVVITEERNYLLNPGHTDFAEIVVGAPRPFSFDPRMRQ